MVYDAVEGVIDTVQEPAHSGLADLLILLVEQPMSVFFACRTRAPLVCSITDVDVVGRVNPVRAVNAMCLLRSMPE